MKAEEVAESAEEEKEEKEEAVVVKKEKVEVAVPSLLGKRITITHHRRPCIIIIASGDDAVKCLQQLTRRWDSERELLYDDIVHVEASACAH